MPFSAIDRKRFKEVLAKMDPDTLVKLGVDTRLKRDTSNAGVVMQLAAAIPSQGSSLIATAVWSGPRSGYYSYKYHIVKKAIQERGLALPPRGFKDVAIPATVGIVTAALGAGADGFDHLFDMTELPKFSAGGAQDLAELHADDADESPFNLSHDDEPPAPGEWIGQLGDAAVGTIENHIQAVADPSTAAKLTANDYSDAFNGQVAENLQDAVDQLGKAISMVLPGGEPLFSAESAQVFETTATSIAIGEVAGKGVEKLFPASTTTPNGLISNTSRGDDLTDEEDPHINHRFQLVAAILILRLVLTGGLMLSIVDNGFAIHSVVPRP